MVWVLEDAPDLPPHLVGLMLGLANHADNKGQAAYPSIATLSWYARKGERVTHRDMAKLLEIGLIRKGNQAHVLHLPPDKRPTVYDLALERKRLRDDDADACGKPGCTTDHPGNHDTKDNKNVKDIAGWSVVPSGVVCSTERGGLQTTQTVLEPPLNQTPLPPTPYEPETYDSAKAETRGGGIFGTPENRTDRADTHQYIPDPDPVMLTCTVCQLPERHWRHSPTGRHIPPPPAVETPLSAPEMEARLRAAHDLVGALTAN